MSKLSLRKSFFCNALQLLSVEYDILTDNFYNYDYWLSGDIELFEVRLLEFKRFFKKRKGNEKVILNNKLNVTSQRVLDMACSSLVCSRLLELNGIDDIQLTVNYIQSLHRILYGDIYSNAGYFRNTEFSMPEKLLSYSTLDFIEVKHIQSIFSSLLDELDTLNNQIEKNTLFYKKVSYFCSMFYYCRPFEYGNLVLMLYVLLRWGNMKGFPLSIENIYKYNSDMYLQRCIILGAYSIANKELISEKTYDKNLSYLADFLEGISENDKMELE